MAVMNPYGDNTNPYSLTFTPPQLITASYNGDSATGEAPSSNYTPPLGLTTGNTVNMTKFTPQVAQQSQGQNLNNDSSQQSPFGISPNQAGSIVSKAINGGFKNQIQQIDNFGSDFLGTGATQAGLTVGGVQGSGLGTASFVDAAGDSVAANAPGAIASGANADIANMFAGATSEVNAANGAAEAGSFTSTSFSSILGSAGIGALEGGLLTKLTGGNQLGGSIGGALGAAAGAALMGTELGAAIGTLIPIPGLGTIAGGLIGGAIGGLFGNNSPPTNATGGGALLTPTGALGTPGIESKKPNATSTGFVGAQMTNFSNAAQAAATANGIKFNPAVQFNANYSSKHGGANIVVTDTKSGDSTGAISFDPNSQPSVQAAYQQALDAAAKYSGTSDTTALDNWYNNTYVKNTTGSFTPQAAPSIPTNSTFAAFVANQQGKSNATNGSSNSTPTV